MAGTLNNPQWWQADAKKAHDLTFPLVSNYLQDQRQRLDDLLKWFRLYGNYNARGLTAATYSKPSNARTNRLTLNVVKSCVDTVQAKIAKNKPKPTYLTSGGSWSQQKRAKLLDKWTQGAFYQADVYKVSPLIFRDAAIFGTGAAKIYRSGSKICFERTFPDELIVDDQEAIFGTPRQLHQRRAIAREQLIAEFPEHEALIKRASPGFDALVMPQFSREQADLVMVVESWHLKTGKDDGRHAITIDTGTLLFEDYDKDYFPFVFISWTKAVRGFWGQGLAEELVGIQFEINKILRQIQDSLDWAVPKCFVEAGSKVVKDHLNADIGGIIKYTGTMPAIEAISTISPELFQQLDRLYSRAYEITGVSVLSAQSKKPAGIESGVALRTLNDIESERFIMSGKAYEDFHMDAARQMIALGKEIGSSNKNYTMTAPEKRRTVQLKWSDVNLDDDDYVMQVLPTSGLPQTPAGRLAMVEDMNNLQLFDTKDELRRLLDFPDLEASNALAEADAEYANMQIEKMIEGEPQTPEPFQNLAYAIKTAQAAYLLVSTMDDVPEENRELLRTYMETAANLLNSATATAPPAATAGAQAMPPMPPGMPMPGMPGPPGGAPQMPPMPPPMQ